MWRCRAWLTFILYPACTGGRRALVVLGKMAQIIGRVHAGLAVKAPFMSEEGARARGNKGLSTKTDGYYGVVDEGWYVVEASTDALAKGAASMPLGDDVWVSDIDRDKRVLEACPRQQPTKAMTASEVVAALGGRYDETTVFSMAVHPDRVEPAPDCGE